MKTVRRENLAGRAFNMWRYAELLPLPEGYIRPKRRRGTPLVASRKLAAKWGLQNLYFKNDGRVLPSLFFKDLCLVRRRRPLPPRAASTSPPWAAPRPVISPTPSLRKPRSQGFRRLRLHSRGPRARKVLNTAVYGRAHRAHQWQLRSRQPPLRAQIADRFQWGLVNREFAPLLISEGSKTRMAMKSPNSWAGRCRTMWSFRWPAAR